MCVCLYTHTHTSFLIRLSDHIASWTYTGNMPRPLVTSRQHLKGIGGTLGYALTVLKRRNSVNDC